MTVQVGKLTVRTAQRGAGRDAGFRVRTESRLRSLDLYPPGLPDRAVLVVRRMDLARVDGSTARRTRAALAGLRQGAPRPAAGPVGASANAVLFGDEVELLACLTADLADGVASRRWYWRAVLPAASAEGGTALAAAWMSRIRWLPASLARLPEPEARSAVSLLSRPDTSRVLQALLAAFGVEEHPALRSPPGPPDPAEPLAAPDQPAPAPAAGGPAVAAMATGHLPAPAGRGPPGGGALPPPRAGPRAPDLLRGAPGGLAGSRRRCQRATDPGRKGRAPGRPAGNRLARIRPVNNGLAGNGLARDGPVHGSPASSGRPGHRPADVRAVG